MLFSFKLLFFFAQLVSCRLFAVLFHFEWRANSIFCGHFFQTPIFLNFIRSFQFFFKETVTDPVWTCRDPIFYNSWDPMIIFSDSRGSIFNSRDPIKHIKNPGSFQKNSQIFSRVNGRIVRLSRMQRALCSRDDFPKVVAIAKRVVWRRTRCVF